MKDYESAFRKAFGEALEKAPVSAAAIARELGVSGAYLSQVKSGRSSVPTRTVIAKVAEAGGVDARALLTLAAMAKGVVELPDLDEEDRKKLARAMVDLAEAAANRAGD